MTLLQPNRRNSYVTNIFPIPTDGEKLLFPSAGKNTLAPLETTCKHRKWAIRGVKPMLRVKKVQLFTDLSCHCQQRKTMGLRFHHQVRCGRHFLVQRLKWLPVARFSLGKLHRVVALSALAFTVQARRGAEPWYIIGGNRAGVFT